MTSSPGGGPPPEEEVGASPPPCVFCAIVAGAAPASFVLRDELCSAFLDLHPVAPGHLLVVPNRHAARLSDLPPEAVARVFLVAADLLAAERRLGLAADGANLLLNDGSAANQSVPHVHVHVVPRRAGDTPRFLGAFAARAAGLAGRPKGREELDALAGRIRDSLEGAGNGPAATP